MVAENAQDTVREGAVKERDIPLVPMPCKRNSTQSSSVVDPLLELGIFERSDTRKLANNVSGTIAYYRYVVRDYVSH